MEVNSSCVQCPKTDRRKRRHSIGNVDIESDGIKLAYFKEEPDQLEYNSIGNVDIKSEYVKEDPDQAILSDTRGEYRSIQYGDIKSEYFKEDPDQAIRSDTEGEIGNVDIEYHDIKLEYFKEDPDQAIRSDTKAEHRTIAPESANTIERPLPCTDMVYTLGIKFQVQGKGSSDVLVGPIDYIASKIDDDHTQYSWSMKHKWCRGVYRVHRVKKMLESTTGDISAGLFTVITLRDLDPLKIVDSLERFTAISAEAMVNDIFFDNRCWMRLAGPTRIAPRCSRHKMSTTIFDYYGPSYKDALLKRLDVAARVCQNRWTREVLCHMNECGDRRRVDLNTFYIRLLAKPMIGKLEIMLDESSPEATGFTTWCNRMQTPSLVGIYHDDGLNNGICGYVMYTKTHTDGKPMSWDKVFAVVLGSAFLSNASVGDTGINDGDTTFGPAVDCSRFLYERHRDKSTLTTRSHPAKKFPVQSSTWHVQLQTEYFPVVPRETATPRERGPSSSTRRPFHVPRTSKPPVPAQSSVRLDFHLRFFPDEWRDRLLFIPPPLQEKTVLPQYRTSASEKNKTKNEGR